MDAWADREMGSAPHLRPTSQMVRMIEAGWKRKTRLMENPRWVFAGSALVCLALIAVMYSLFIHPSLVREKRLAKEYALVGLRSSFFHERLTDAGEPKGMRGKGEKGGRLEMGGTKEPFPFEQLTLQYQKPDFPSPKAVDLLAAQAEAVALTSTDNYRIILKPARDSQIYIFQSTSYGAIVQLFPNENFSSVQNPLRKGQTYCLPSESSWLYMGKTRGEERLYVISAGALIQDLDDLYARFLRMKEGSKKQEILSRLVKRLDALKGANRANASCLEFFITHH
jgi:hypothetical protein